jgi:tetratricopeptide (TPR) repeat protein
MAFGRPLCLAMMPFGVKKDPVTSAEINFDFIYQQAIKPAIEAANMEPVRADDERASRIIHKPMFEKLLLCDFAIADLTTGNSKVYYELGVRHAVRPMHTLAIFAEHHKPPFDLSVIRALPYRLGEGYRFGPREADELTSKLMRHLQGLLYGEGMVDSPMFQLMTEFKGPDITSLESDVFRERVDYSARIKGALARARDLGDLEAVKKIESELGEFDAAEAGILVDLFLTWRALSSWDRMISLYQKLPGALKRSVMIREQVGLALNRVGRGSEALKILESVLYEQGPSPETLGLIGRIYKDQWIEARGQEMRMALGYLDKAIGAYISGFEADSRDAYPGINAVTLLDIKGDEEALRQKEELLPVVRFAVKQRLKKTKPIYWDYATLLELAVLENNEVKALQYLSEALSCVREPWEAVTTANNLHLIMESRRERRLSQPWLVQIIAELETRSRSTTT